MSVPATAVRESVLDRVLRDFGLAAASADAAVHAVRARAAARLEELGWPSMRDEQWRYANLRAFEQLHAFRPVAHNAVDAAAALRSLQPQLPPPVPGFERLICLDGLWLDTAGLPAGAGRPLANAAVRVAVELPAGRPWPAEQRLGLLSDMFATETARLTLHGEAAIEVLFLSSARAAGAAVYPGLELQIEAGSQLQLIERHLGAPAGASLVAGALTVELARDATLRHYRLQQYGRETLLSDTLAAQLGERARYAVRSVGIGAGTARTSARVELCGRGATLTWQAIAVGRGEQVQDVSLKVEHRAAETETEEVFRGIADERARLAFSGHIEIDAAAPGSQARQSLRGLIEGAQAEIDLRPRLEIRTDEVRAQHGATTGRLDEESLFYLLARGIDRSRARALLKWAFLSDVLREIELPAVRSEAERLAAGQLPQSIGIIGALA